MPPVSLAPWSGVRLAHTPSPVCPQNIPPKAYLNQNDLHNTAPRSHWRQLEMSNLQRMLRNQSEDCLYLNIYSPLGKFYCHIICYYLKILFLLSNLKPEIDSKCQILCSSLVFLFG